MILATTQHAAQPRFRGNFTVYTKGISAEQESDVLSFLASADTYVKRHQRGTSLQWVMRADNTNTHSFIMAHIPPGAKSQQPNRTMDEDFMETLVKKKVPFLWTGEPIPSFSKAMRDSLENGGHDLSTQHGVAKVPNHQILYHYTNKSSFHWAP